MSNTKLRIETQLGLWIVEELLIAKRAWDITIEEYEIKRLPFLCQVYFVYRDKKEGDLGHAVVIANAEQKPPYGNFTRTDNWAHLHNAKTLDEAIVNTKEALESTFKLVR